MEYLSLVLLHVFFGAIWAGGAIATGFFIVPAVLDAGPAGGPVMAGVAKRKFPTVMSVAAVLTVLAGIRLYSIRYAPGWVASKEGIVLSLGALLGIGAFVMGVFIRDHFGPLVVSTLGWIPVFDGTPLITGLFSACIILTIMILPTVMAVSRDVIAAVPGSQREGILALGATRWEAIRIAVLPYARSGVMGAAILGLARAVGETLAVTLVIGNSVKLPENIFSPAYTMASVIANQFPEATGLHRSALLEVALLLLVITFFINVVARLLVWRVTRGQRAMVQE